MARKQTLSLPTDTIEPAEHLWEHNFAIWGRKGIGKSTSTKAIQWMLNEHFGKGKKKALNFRFEQGRVNLRDMYQVPEEKGRRLVWADFKAYIELFCEDDDFPVGVIDSLDKAYDSCMETVCQDNYGVDHPGEISNTKERPTAWDLIKNEFEFTFRAAIECEKRFVFLSHEKEKTDQLTDGTEYVRYDLSCKPAAAKIVKDLCEFVLHYGYTGTSQSNEKGVVTSRSSDRVISVRNRNNSLEVACGRDDVFLDPDGRILYRFKMPSPTDSSIDIAKVVGGTLLAAYNNELYDYDYDPEAEARAERAKQRIAERRAAKSKSRNLPTSPRK